MAILWTDIANGEVLSSVRTKINNLADDVVTLEAAHSAELDALDVRMTAEETKLSSAISITSGVKAAQTLVADTPEKLEWMTTALVANGGTDITYDIPTDNITILTAGTYRVFGVITLQAPVNDLVDVELYIDNLPTGFLSSAIGRGTASSISYAYSFLTPFIVNDDITLYVTSTGTTITVQAASMTVELTGY